MWGLGGAGCVHGTTRRQSCHCRGRYGPSSPGSPGRMRRAPRHSTVTGALPYHLADGPFTFTSSPAMSTTKPFASAADLQVKQVRFDKLSEHAYAYTAEGDPNTGVIIGDDAVMVIDTQATPVMAQDVIRRIR